jgi:hypothetical protein
VLKNFQKGGKKAKGQTGEKEKIKTKRKGGKK